MFLGPVYHVAQDKVFIFHLCAAQAIITECKIRRMGIDIKDSDFCIEFFLCPILSLIKKNLKDITILAKIGMECSKQM